MGKVDRVGLRDLPLNAELKTEGAGRKLAE